MKVLKIVGIAAAAAIVAGLIMNFGDVMRYIKIERM